MKRGVSVTIFALLIAIYCRPSECAKKKMDLNGLNDMLAPMSKSCKTKTGVAEEVIAGARKGNFPPDDQNLKCYFRCLSGLLKIMDKKGQVQLKNINNQLDLLVQEDLAEKIKAIFKYCVDTVSPKEDSCDYAYDLLQCGYVQDPSLFIM